MASPTCGECQTNSRYTLKPQAHSSHSLILQLLPENGRGLKLLDVGCADGYLSRLFAARGFSVTAIDAVAPQAQPLPDVIRFLETDLDHGLPPVADDFDFVVCADVLEHLRDPEQLLRQVRSRMTAGGKLVASLPNSGNLYFRLNVLLGKFPEHDSGLFDRTHLHFYMWKGWRNLLTRSGFRITAARQSVVPFSLRWPNHAGLTALVESAYAVMARAWPRLFAYQFVIVAESW
jgi:SAM-dependent methyltransferase